MNPRGAPERSPVILNRATALTGETASGLEIWAGIPDDPEVRRFDQEGGPLLELPHGNSALRELPRSLTERLRLELSLA